MPNKANAILLIQMYAYRLIHQTLIVVIFQIRGSEFRDLIHTGLMAMERV
jgi:hypothetical protein